MMNAKKCDRCKQFYDCITTEYAGRIDGIKRVSDSYAVSHFDLCPACLRSFDAWLDLRMDLVTDNA